MRNLNEGNITDAVTGAGAGCEDPRLRPTLEALVRHLHAFVREVEPTEEEWTRAIDFLTRTGQICSDTRQEYILLSDVLGVTMLVDAINHRARSGVTDSSVLGPFYVEGPPETTLGSGIDWNVEGEPFYVEGRIMSEDGSPLAGVTVDVWQSDSEGFYDVQNEIEGASLRARLRTGEDGRYAFWTITPSPYPIPTDGPVGQLLERMGRHPYRPAHVHFMLSADGFERLVTQIFAEGDPYIDSDAVFGVKDTLVRPYAEQAPGTAPDGTVVDRPWRHLVYDFGLRRAA
jgi:hydroxyquinol 1,2-dioxygenase